MISVVDVLCPKMSFWHSGFFKWKYDRIYHICSFNFLNIIHQPFDFCIDLSECFCNWVADNVEICFKNSKNFWAGIAHSVERLLWLTLWGRGTIDPILKSHQCLFTSTWIGMLYWRPKGQQRWIWVSCFMQGDPHWLSNPGYTSPEVQKKRKQIM